jgi:uncharacterized membrane protein YoaK (UPF0700 family)
MGSLREAWTTIVPDLKGPHGPLPPMLLALTVVTGLVDAYSYLLLGHAFVANMTGNVVFAGFAIAGAPDFVLAAALTALAAFVVGAFVAAAIGRTAGGHRGQLLVRALAVETVFVAAAYVVALLGGTADRYLLIVLLGIAMGTQNTTARTLAVPDLTTTVLTLTLTGIAADTKWFGGAGSKLGRRLLSVAAMFVGGLVGATAIVHGLDSLPLLVTTVVLVVVTAAAFLASRAGGPWTRPKK